MIRKLTAITISALSCLYLLSCESGNTEKQANQKAEKSTFDMQWAKSFIDSINSKFSEQFAAGDSVALASHYWSNAELLLDNSEPVKGSDILNAWGSAIRMGIKEITFSTTDITVDSTFLIETGNYEMKDAKRSMVDKGKY